MTTHDEHEDQGAPGALEDLRFTIGLFFLLVGGILLLAAVLPPGPGDVPAGALQAGVNLNLWVGLVFLAFAGLMLALYKFGAVGRRGSPTSE